MTACAGARNAAEKKNAPGDRSPGPATYPQVWRIEPIRSRDHTELMLGLETIDRPDGVREIIIDGRKPIAAKPFSVPADPSAACFMIALGLLGERSEIVLRDAAKLQQEAARALRRLERVTVAAKAWMRRVLKKSKPFMDSISQRPNAFGKWSSNLRVLI